MSGALVPEDQRVCDRQLLAAAGTAADQPGPAVVAFGPVGDGTAVAVYGTGLADVTTAHGPQRLTAGEPYGRAAIRADVSAARCRQGGELDAS
jgi:hypothetical protein